MIICRGVGLEPQVIIGKMHGDVFEPTTSIVFNPILTHSQGDEQEVVIKNPCTFPVEIYNLEFDKQFLEEEKVRADFPNQGFDSSFVFSFFRSFVCYQVTMKTITFFYQPVLLAINCLPNYKSFTMVKTILLFTKNIFTFFLSV